MNMPIKDFATTLRHSGDEAIEAKALRELSAAQSAAYGPADDVVVFQDPDNHALFQRLHTWSYLRLQKPALPVSQEDAGCVSEPEWPRHWATTKYI